MNVKEIPAESTELNVAFMAMASCGAGEENREAIARVCRANNIKKV